jgi:hypothetical protein
MAGCGCKKKGKNLGMPEFFSNERSGKTNPLKKEAF